ncbi:coiled-coil domain-containing protein 93 isoform X3 [Eucalyptus grandis]|uniref:coiled-coil domain-containing protein 93 isoform X3 n=1 Tax=Eucalyptus grandis TaxID=71139 RepID=UPI00192E9B5C|nr:coiled-coil domain-containing protein 93 isoform X3 [Eucalyptus grandis]
MAEPPSDSPSQLTAVVGLLESIDLGPTRRRHPPDAAALVAGLSRCIRAVDPELSLPSPETLTQDNIREASHGVEEALKLLNCPHPLQASDIYSLEVGSVYPVARWLVNHVRIRIGVTGDEENPLWQLDGGLGAAGTTFESRYSDPEEKKLMRMHILEEMQLLHEKIRAAKVDSVVRRLMLLMKSLKVLEKKELDCQSDNIAKKSDLEAKIIHLEEKITNNCDSKSLHDDLDHCISISLEKLHLAKKELAARLRMLLSVRRQLEDVPSQSELIQYEHRFSELNINIEEIHRQTRKYYATYNALLELKELMLKETSLLNSLNSQFQDAISDTAGRLKLIDSTGGILKGIKQFFWIRQHRQIVLLCRSYRKCKRGSRLIRESAIHSGRSMRQQQLVRDAVLVC